MPTETNELDARIAQRLLSLRRAKGLSLVDLAALSGVSKAMISRVERADSSPTATILGRLAAGLGVTLTELLVAPAPERQRLRRRAEQPLWRDPELGYLRRQVAPPDARGAMEMVEVEMPEGACVSYPNWGGAPYMQRLWMLEGALHIECGDATFELETGDSLDFSVERPVSFRARGPRGCRYLLVMAPADGQ